MKKYNIICRLLFSFVCIVFLLTSCDDSAKGPDKPTVVRKKVTPRGQTTVATQRPRPTAQPIQPVSSPTATEIEPVRTEATPTAEPSSPTVTKAIPVAPPPADKPQPKPMLAQTDTQNSARGEAVPPPKSDISELPKQPPAASAPAPGTAASAPAQDNDNAIMLASAEGDMPLYNPAGKVDPFEPLYKDQPSQSKALQKKRKVREPTTPLERIDISQLRLVGIIVASSGNRALVEESSGKGYVIIKGTYIGTNAGKVTDIKKDMVIVEEEFEDVFGKLQVQKKEIKLPKPPGEL